MLACVVVAGACRGEPARAPAAADDHAVVVASFDFPESRLLAEIYAGALEDARIPVRRELELGPRELVAPALAQGDVDVVPEYLGTAAASVAPGAPGPVTGEALLATLTAALGARGIRVLEPSAAQNQNAVVVERSTSARLGLERISDLRRHAPALTVAGPSECPDRPLCLQGLRARYGLRFGHFLPLDGAARVVRALDDGVADVGVLFSTDGDLADPRLVVLDDDAHLQPPENVVPVVREAAIRRHGERVVRALDAVSSQLTTTALRLLDWRITVGGRDMESEARAWLIRRGLIAG